MDITKADLNDFTNYLIHIELIESSDCVTSTKIPGDGNMNFTLRLNCKSGKSYIIKQSPPYCAKFPQIAAPKERIIVEHNFYKLVSSSKAKDYFPKTFYLNKEESLMLMEDLGEIEDLGSLYRGDKLTLDRASLLIKSLIEINSIIPSFEIPNIQMRKLNSAHIFNIPFEKDNGLNLDEITMGLGDIKNNLIMDKKLLESLKRLESLYFSQASHLLHGDFYPHSWFHKDEKIYIIDPEFAFTGKVEFDLGNFFGHLVITSHPAQILKLVYDKAASSELYDMKLSLQFAGVEILRRLLGYAQLPISLSLTDKQKLINIAKSLVLSPGPSHLFT
jgi:5-methylthioribose kinase